jgi:hypothetical protein
VVFIWEAGGVSEGMPLANDTEVLAWVVLWAANRTQAKGSSVRLVDPRAPEVAHEVGMELITEAQLVEVEEYLHCHGYVEPVDMGLSWGTYTITPAGVAWLEGGMPGFPSSKDRVREHAKRPGEEAALELALRSDLEEERRRMEGLERELDEGIERERHQRQIPRRLQRGLSEARKQLGEERSWWRRMFGG